MDGHPERCLFETHDLVTGYDEPLSKPLNFSMERGQKIALVGTNGIGKTTLIEEYSGIDPIVIRKLRTGRESGDWLL